MKEQLFHLAIPCLDTEATKVFYTKLGCEVAREHHDRVNLIFFGEQVVCHLSSEDKIDPTPQMYPRHFGITFRGEENFNAVFEKAQAEDLEFFQKLFIRFSGKPEEHKTFFLKDPANNLIEFKFYKNPEFMY